MKAFLVRTLDVTGIGEITAESVESHMAAKWASLLDGVIPCPTDKTPMQSSAAETAVPNHGNTFDAIMRDIQKNPGHSEMVV